MMAVKLHRLQSPCQVIFGFSHFQFHCLAEMFPIQSRVVTDLLVLAVVPGHGAVGSLSLDGLAVRANEN